MSEKRILEEKMVTLGKLTAPFPGLFGFYAPSNSLNEMFKNTQQLALLEAYQRYPQDIVAATAALKLDRSQSYENAELRFSRWHNQEKWNLGITLSVGRFPTQQLHLDWLGPVGRPSTNVTGHFVTHNVYFMLTPEGMSIVPPEAEKPSTPDQVSCQVARQDDLLIVDYQNFPYLDNKRRLTLPAFIEPTRFE